MKKANVIRTITMVAFTAVIISSCNETKREVTSAESKAPSNTYSLKNGVPADQKTIDQAHYATNLRRAIEAYKFFFPTLATEAVMQQFEPHGAIANEVGIIMPQDPEQQFSVANQDTPYAIGVFDLRNGPIVIDVPAGPFMGLMNDHHMEWFGDMGVIGPGKGQGEKDILIPPGYEGEIPEGYHPFYSKTWMSVMAMRVVVNSGSYKEAVSLAQQIKVYPLSEAGKPSNYKIIDVRGQKAPLPMLSWEKSMDYWKQLHDIINGETAQEKHRVMLGMLAGLGIKKGQDFNPDEATKAILMEASTSAFAEMSVAFFANPRPERLIWEDRLYFSMPLAGSLDPDTKEFGNKNYRDLLANDHYFFSAWGTSAGIGRRQVGEGSLYFVAVMDAQENYFDGGENYKLNIPGPVPAKLFWSVTVYDTETRTIIDSGQGRGAVRTMFEKPEPNSDGSFDIFFGPDKPEGKENNWVKTIPGKGWFTFVRMYGPEEPIFDGTYKLPDIVSLN